MAFIWLFYQGFGIQSNELIVLLDQVEFCEVLASVLVIVEFTGVCVVNWCNSMQYTGVQFNTVPQVMYCYTVFKYFTATQCILFNLVQEWFIDTAVLLWSVFWQPTSDRTVTAVTKFRWQGLKRDSRWLSLLGQRFFFCFMCNLWYFARTILC